MATVERPTRLSLSWTASTDIHTGVANYRIYRNNVLNQTQSFQLAAGAQIVVSVPADKELENEIRHALSSHVERALDSAFPQGRDTAPGRSARTMPGQSRFTTQRREPDVVRVLYVVPSANRELALSYTAAQ